MVATAELETIGWVLPEQRALHGAGIPAGNHIKDGETTCEHLLGKCRLIQGAAGRVFVCFTSHRAFGQRTALPVLVRSDKKELIVTRNCTQLGARLATQRTRSGSRQ